MYFSKTFQAAALFVSLILAPAFAQDAWYDHYSRAMTAIQDHSWRSAIDHLQKSLQRKPNPDQDAETYALVEVEYIPYYWLGVVHFNRGEWTLAASNFEKSDSWREINISSKSDSFKDYRKLLSTLQRKETGTDSLRNIMLQLDEKNSRYQRLFSLLAELVESEHKGDSALYKEKLAGYKELATELALQSEIRNIHARLSKTEVVKQPAPVVSEFFGGVDAYLTGDLERARRVFATVPSTDPLYLRSQNWLQKTVYELERIRKSDDGIEPLKPDTVMLTGAPVIAIGSYSDVIRKDSILISGSVADDHGLAFVGFTLNGISYPAGNSPLRLRPEDDDQAKQLPFEVSFPLRMGENQIVVVARDNDPEFHQSTYPITIERRNPFYRSSQFLGMVIISLILIAGFFVTNQLVRRRIAFVNRYNPYIAGAPIRNEKMFFGREKLLQRIMNTIDNNSLMLYGPRRIGKTTLLHQLKQRLTRISHNGVSYVPVYVDLQGTPEERFFAGMMEDILENIVFSGAQDLDLHIRSVGREDYSARQFGRDIRSLLNFLEKHIEGPFKLVLLIDEVDELNTYSERTNQRLRSIFMKSFAENIVAVMSGSYIKRQWESEGSPWYNFFERIEVSGIDSGTAKQLICEPVNGIFRYDDEAVGRIIEYSENVPYRIQKFCINVINRIIEARRHRVTVEDVESVKAKVLSEVEA